jgi:hypothetical protein
VSIKNKMLWALRLKRFLLEIFDFFVIIPKFAKLKPKKIWMGDSHSHFIARSGKRIRKYSVTSDGDLLIWLGPRLLYSISENGFRFNCFAKYMLRRFGTRTVIILVLGEIDCRVHLVSRALHSTSSDLNRMVSKYRSKIEWLLDTFDIETAKVLTPVPPSNIGKIDRNFPRNGSLDERILITKLLSEALQELSAEDIDVIDLSHILSDTSGSFNSIYTDDGVHVNQLGSKVVLTRLGFIS